MISLYILHYVYSIVYQKRKFQFNKIISTWKFLQINYKKMFNMNFNTIHYNRRSKLNEQINV